MSLLMNQAGTKESSIRVPGASRSVQPQIPSKPAIAPVSKPKTAAPARPIAPPSPSVPLKPAVSATLAPSSIPWMYRGTAVDPDAVQANRMLTQSSRANSSAAVVYRGIKVDPAFVREQAMLAGAVRASSTASLMYRGIRVPRG